MIVAVQKHILMVCLFQHLIQDAKLKRKGVKFSIQFEPGASRLRNSTTKHSQYLDVLWPSPKDKGNKNTIIECGTANLNSTTYLNLT
jgi:hypothetical protein